MKKYTLWILLLVAGVVLLAGCSGGNQSASSPKPTALDVTGVYSKLSELNKVENPREVDDFSITNDFNLKADQIAEYKGALGNTMSIGGVNLVVKAKDGSESEVKSALEAYLAAQVEFYGKYAEFGDVQALLKKGVVQSSGNVIVLAAAGTNMSDLDIASTVKDVLK